MNALFGERFDSMLNDALRVNSGLTYGANSVLDLHREAGAITITTYTRTETTGQAIDMALDVLKTLNEKGITAEQLSSVKNYTKGMYPDSGCLRRPISWPNVLSDIELFGLNRGEVDDMFSPRIDAVTAPANEPMRLRKSGTDLTNSLLSYLTMHRRFGNR